MNAGEEFFSLLTRRCESLAPLPAHVFYVSSGSHARAEATASSDIDLMVIVDDEVDIHDAGWSDQVRGISKTGLEVDG